MTISSQTIKKRALISVSDKNGLLELSKFLTLENYEILASSGTYKFLIQNNIPAIEISTITKSPEILEGRVKTLHPQIHGDNEVHIKDLEENSITPIDLIVVNLYQFEKLIEQGFDQVELKDAIEQVDIGGVALIRSGAKNFSRVTTLTSPEDYSNWMDLIKKNSTLELNLFKKELALKAFEKTSNYDSSIREYFSYKFKSRNRIPLKYGLNPHQSPALISIGKQDMPLNVLNGNPGYINLLDALNSWQLVKDVSSTLNLEAAASFKHVSPAGVGLGLPMDDDEQQFLRMSTTIKPLSAIARAYLRARSADPLSSFGDWVALSHECDLDLAEILSKEVSDGIIAPSFSTDAYEVLKRKKNGMYLMIQINSDYNPGEKGYFDKREVFGIEMKQFMPNCDYSKWTDKIVSKAQLDEKLKMDLILAAITVKYVQSNSVCLARNGTVIGIGAGQQSRIHCTKLACNKADKFVLRKHPKIQSFEFIKGIKKQDKINVIDFYLDLMEADEEDFEYQNWSKSFEKVPTPLSLKEKREFIKENGGSLIIASDGFFPFEDNVFRAYKSNVKAIIAPMGSIRDPHIVTLADELGMVYVESPQRLFHH